uniref:Uncharacterized protein n=1 Tax=Mesocestoides corti TaxID=53468 RepID=A0A5K3G7F6_MESCO
MKTSRLNLRFVLQGSKTVQTRDENGTINSAMSDQAAQTGETEHSPHTPSLKLASTEKRSGFLKAHEKTGQLDTMMVLSEIPVKPAARTANPERLHVPKASSAKDIQFIRRDLNY